MYCCIIGSRTWFKKNGPFFYNVAKTKLMCFRHPHKRIDLDSPLFLHATMCADCKCMPMEYVCTTKYLGIRFDEHLTWRNHTEFVAKRLRVLSAFLYRLRSVVDVALRFKVFQALGDSILRYSSTAVCGACSTSRKQRLDNILHKK